jgi:hypothetical protein
VRPLGTTPARLTILDGFLQFRQRLRAAGLAVGFQWLNGSFLQDVERFEGRDPGDLDVVTFYWTDDPTLNGGWLSPSRSWWMRKR